MWMRRRTRASFWSLRPRWPWLRSVDIRLCRSITRSWPGSPRRGMLLDAFRYTSIWGLSFCSIWMDVGNEVRMDAGKQRDGPARTKRPAVEIPWSCAADPKVTPPDACGVEASPDPGARPTRLARPFVTAQVFFKLDLILPSLHHGLPAISIQSCSLGRMESTVGVHLFETDMMIERGKETLMLQAIDGDRTRVPPDVLHSMMMTGAMPAQVKVLVLIAAFD